MSSSLCGWAAAADSPDASFYKNAAEGGIAEVEAGKLAQQKSSNPQVKNFGAMMVKDHTAANDKLKTLADSKTSASHPPSSVGQMAGQGKNLKYFTGDAFDKSYVKGQVTAHQDTIALFKKEIATGQDPDAKAFAEKTLPTVRAHLKAINAIATTVGAAN